MAFAANATFTLIIKDKDHDGLKYLSMISMKSYGSKWAGSRLRLMLWDEGPYGKGPTFQLGQHEIEGFHKSTTIWDVCRCYTCRSPLQPTTAPLWHSTGLLQVIVYPRHANYKLWMWMVLEAMLGPPVSSPNQHASTLWVLQWTDACVQSNIGSTGYSRSGLVSTSKQCVVVSG